MDSRFILREVEFVWDRAKAASNERRHQVGFEQAAEAFFDPFLKLVDATRDDEARDAILGLDFRLNVLYVVHAAREGSSIRIISARKATREERALYEN